MEQELFFTKNPLIITHQQLRLALARGYVLSGVFKRVFRFVSVTSEEEEMVD